MTIWITINNQKKGGNMKKELVWKYTTFLGACLMLQLRASRRCHHRVSFRWGHLGGGMLRRPPIPLAGFSYAYSCIHIQQYTR